MIRLIQSKPRRIIIRRDLKVETVSEVRLSSGREFQRHFKTLDPMVVLCPGLGYTGA